MKQERLYFDYNATAPLRSQAIEAMYQIFKEVGNASSVHSYGRAMRHEIEAARRTIGSLLMVSPESIVFTSGGTEANNTVIQTFVKRGAPILVSAVEHSCVLQVSSTPEVIPVLKTGVVNLSKFEQLLASNANQEALVSVMMANNETGVIQPLSEIVTISRKYNARLHTDAVQAIGKIPCGFADLGVDYLTLSSHKIGGPPGVGALIVKQGAPFDSFIVGAGQEKGRRAGSYNTPAIVGFAVALEHAIKEDWAQTGRLRDYFEEQIRTYCPDVVIFGADVERVANTSYLAMPGVNQETQVMAFDLEGIAVSAGSACSSGKISASHVLQAMGYSLEIAQQAVRISFGPTVQKQQIDRLVRAWKELYERTQHKN